MPYRLFLNMLSATYATLKITLFLNVLHIKDADMHQC